MTFWSKLSPAVLGLLLLAHSAPLLAEPPAGPGKTEPPPATGRFIRLQRDDADWPTALQTAIARFKPAAGQGELIVDLIAAVHVGDRAYYDRLNKEFEQYDVLLYELVAPPGTRIRKGGPKDSGNPLVLIQQVLKVALDLDSQTECIDYTRANFVHADLSLEQMAEAIRGRGDDGLTIGLSIAADLLRQQNVRGLKQPKPSVREEKPDLDLAALLLDADGPARLKRLLAQQLADPETPAVGLGPTLNTILISDRNQAALKVFQKELAKGRKKIGIFYGAAHLDDFDKRLSKDFGLKRDELRWLTAWDLRKKRGIEDLLKLLGP